MKAMNEVFAITGGASPSSPQRVSSPGLSPASSPTGVRRPPQRPNSLAHRRSASSLPTLTESLEPASNVNKDTTFAPPTPTASWQAPSPTNTDLAMKLQEQQKAAMPASARHNRRASLAHLKTRLEDDVPDIALTKPSPETRQGQFGDSSGPSKRRSIGVDFSQQANQQLKTRMREEHIFCGHCYGDLLSEFSFEFFDADVSDAVLVQSSSIACLGEEVALSEIHECRNVLFDRSSIWHNRADACCPRALATTPL